MISGFLGPNEHFLWAGRPDPRRFFAPVDVFLVPFSLFWLAFAIFWEVGALTAVLSSPGLEPVALLFPLFGVPFVAIGLYMAVGRFVVKARRRRRTHYALTNRRVLAVDTRDSGPTVQALFLDQIPAVNTRVRADGSGTLTFGQPSGGVMAMYDDTGMELFTGGAIAPLSFRDVPNAADVASAVDRAREEARGRAPGPTG